MEPITLINSFEVPAGREDEFLALWSDVSHFMRKQPGYIEHRLHRALAPDAPYRFINVVRWESAEMEQAAHETEGFRQFVQRPEWTDFPQHPILFEVVSTHHI